ncbi:hypothetical protein OCU04_012185 [Sclerotinia nivalis]|uniref:HIT-type domain-containing protein n=1 Tax=Sclerotinia nivalis TaxID=352851 RepID=A0A9X0AB73_9HELO|nr:hypothetical protein OCU04_012185 [Sclerotinia nivalis]
MNFGVLEIAPSKAAPAPGWAYVPDISSTPQIGLQPSSRRARGPNSAGSGALNAHETTKKQDAKILRELQLLDRENHRDVCIPVTARRDGRVTQGKLTPAVRKILASQKTFANHLSDYEALASLPSTSTSTSTTQQPASPAVSTPQASTPGPGLTSTGKRSHKRKEPLPPGIDPPKRSHKKKDPNAPIVSTPLRKSSTPSLKPELPPTSTPLFAPLITSLAPPKPHPRDTDPLLISRVPNLPSQEEMERLLAAPPLSYNEARGGCTDEDRRKPGRVFCEVCGYWGRVRCLRCAGRVCALECLEVHKEECFARYGA